MFNWFKIKSGILNYKGEIINLIYGTKDPSIGYIELLKSLNKNIKVYELLEDHNFTYQEEDFYTLPDKYLFYDYREEK